MSNIEKMRLLLAICLAFGSLTSRAQGPDQPPADHSPVQVRSFNDSVLMSLKSERSFQYDAPALRDLGLFEQLLDGFWAWVRRLSKRPVINTGLEFLLWVLPILLILYALLRLTGMEKALPWFRARRGHLPFEVHAEDVHAIDFQTEISRAVSESRFRDATRLHYLHALRRLSDANRIHWAIDKTNHDYQRELAGTQLEAPFQAVTRIFEFAWYGEVPVSGQTYQGISRSFDNFLQKIST